MSIFKIAIGVALGIALAWGGLALYGVAQKQIAIEQCVAGVGHDNVRVYEIEFCMKRHGWHAVMTGDGIDWAK